MLYSEFITGTGCKDNSHNYQVFKNLEIMYMHSDMTKDQIYAYGKKLVDNRFKSEERQRIETLVNAEIEELKREIASFKADISLYQQYVEISADRSEMKMWKGNISWKRELIRKAKARIAALRWVLQD